jgi:hypothetical protein
VTTFSELADQKLLKDSLVITRKPISRRISASKCLA